MNYQNHRGLSAARYSKAIFNGRDNPSASLAYAESQSWSDTIEVNRVLRSAVAAATTANSPALLEQVGVDFSAAVRPLSVIGRINGFRHVPTRVRLLTGTSGTTSHWVGEGNPKPISRAGFANLNLDALKTVAICVVTKELLQFSTPKADQTLQDDMSAAAAESIDLAFIDPDNTGIPGVKPASVTSGATPIVSTGSTIAQIDADLAAMVDQLTTAGSTLADAVWIMKPSTATSLSMKRGSGGDLAYPGITAKGGELLGLPVITTPYMSGESSGSFIALLDASAVALADEDESLITIVTQASLQLADDPSVDASATLVSLFQTNCAAIKVERFVNWHLRRAGFVSVLSDVDY